MAAPLNRCDTPAARQRLAPPLLRDLATRTHVTCRLRPRDIPSFVPTSNLKAALNPEDSAVENSPRWRCHPPRQFNKFEALCVTMPIR